MPSPEQMEAYGRQAEWARKIAVSIDLATLRARARLSRARGCAGSSEHVHHESLLLCRATIESVPASIGCIINLGEEHGWVVRMIRAGLRRPPFSTIVRAED
jgi:hypothetical protein